MSIIPATNVRYTLMLIDERSESTLAQSSMPFQAPSLGSYFEFNGDSGFKISGTVSEVRTFVIAQSGNIDNITKVEL
jgi:hypothetical protein